MEIPWLQWRKRIGKIAAMKPLFFSFFRSAQQKALGGKRPFFEIKTTKDFPLRDMHLGEEGIIIKVAGHLTPKQYY